MNIEYFARHYSGSVLLNARLERGPDGLAYVIGTQITLCSDGSVKVEDYKRVHYMQESGYVVCSWDELPAEIRARHTPAELPAPPGTFYASHEVHDDLILHWGVRPYYVPLDEVQFAQASHQLAQDKRRDALTLWPSTLYAGRVNLAGSGDRWVIGCGSGGHLTFLRGTYRSVADAEAALRAELERRQARVAELIAERCAPHPVPCLFPAITIEVVGDTRIVCLDLTNRRARRQLRFAA